MLGDMVALGGDAVAVTLAVGAETVRDEPN